MALNAVTSVVLQEMLASLAVKKTAAEAWEAVRSYRLTARLSRTRGHND
jgi:hypothetical protein